MRALITYYNDRIQSVNIVNRDEAPRALGLLRAAARESGHADGFRIEAHAVDALQTTLDYCFRDSGA